MTTMHGVVCEQIENFVVKELEIPEIKDDQVLLHVKQIGVCGTDFHAFRGNQPFFEYPRVFGHEIVGVVEKVGSAVSEFVAGDKVVPVPYLACGNCIACKRGKPNCCTSVNVIGVHSDGGMREFLPVPAAALVKAPDSMTFDQLVVVECLAIGAHAVARAEVTSSDTVLVVGAGPIGLSAMQFAKALGATVIALDIADSRLEFAKERGGVDHTINSTSEDVVAKLMEYTGGTMPTCCVEATGHNGSMAKAIEYVAHSGVLVYVGITKADLTFKHIEMHKRELTIKSARNATKKDFALVIDCIQDGRVKVDWMITHRATIGNFVEEFNKWLDPATGVFKAVLSFE